MIYSSKQLVLIAIMIVMSSVICAALSILLFIDSDTDPLKCTCEKVEQETPRKIIELEK